MKDPLALCHLSLSRYMLCIMVSVQAFIPFVHPRPERVTMMRRSSQDTDKVYEVGILLLHYETKNWSLMDNCFPREISIWQVQIFCSPEAGQILSLSSSLQCNLSAIKKTVIPDSYSMVLFTFGPSDDKLKPKV